MIRSKQDHDVLACQAEGQRPGFKKGTRPGEMGKALISPRRAPSPNAWARRTEEAT
jgi:hypothetical protein